MFNGEIVFDIADVKHLEVDLGVEMIPTKIVNKDDVVALVLFSTLGTPDLSFIRQIK